MQKYRLEKAIVSDGIVVLPDNAIPLGFGMRLSEPSQEKTRLRDRIEHVVKYLIPEEYNDRT